MTIQSLTKKGAGDVLRIFLIPINFILKWFNGSNDVLGTKTLLRLFPVVKFANKLEKIGLGEFLKLFIVNAVDQDVRDVPVGRDQAVGQHAVLVQQVVALGSLKNNFFLQSLFLFLIHKLDIHFWYEHF